MATLPRESWSVATIRKTSGISLEEIARNTKLRVTTLKAIEDANFDLLPGGIYNISYIRQMHAPSARTKGRWCGSTRPCVRTKVKLKPAAINPPNAGNNDRQRRSRAAGCD